jgi:hypothetical protein
MERSISGLESVKARVAEGFRSLKDRLTPGKQYIIEFSDEFDSLLGGIARRKGIHKGEVIRYAIASYAFLQQELKPDAEHPEKHLVIRKGEKILREIQLP